MAVAGPRDLILQVLLLHPPVSPLGRELAAAEPVAWTSYRLLPWHLARAPGT